MDKMESGSGIVVLDLHGKNHYQARIALDAALRRADAGVYRLRVIHGWHGGNIYFIHKVSFAVFRKKLMYKVEDCF